MKLRLTNFVKVKQLHENNFWLLPDESVVEVGTPYKYRYHQEAAIDLLGIDESDINPTQDTEEQIFKLAYKKNWIRFGEFNRSCYVTGGFVNQNLFNRIQSTLMSRPDYNTKQSVLYMFETPRIDIMLPYDEAIQIYKLTDLIRESNALSRSLGYSKIRPVYV